MQTCQILLISISFSVFSYSLTDGGQSNCLSKWMSLMFCYGIVTSYKFSYLLKYYFYVQHSNNWPSKEIITPTFKICSINIGRIKFGMSIILSNLFKLFLSNQFFHLVCKFSITILAFESLAPRYCSISFTSIYKRFH